MKTFWVNINKTRYVHIFWDINTFKAKKVGEATYFSAEGFLLGDIVFFLFIKRYKFYALYNNFWKKKLMKFAMKLRAKLKPNQANITYNFQVSLTDAPEAKFYFGYNERACKISEKSD